MELYSDDLEISINDIKKVWERKDRIYFCIQEGWEKISDKFNLDAKTGLNLFKEEIGMGENHYSCSKRFFTSNSLSIGVWKQF